jgi:hypothetical protein
MRYSARLTDSACLAVAGGGSRRTRSASRDPGHLDLAAFRRRHRSRQGPALVQTLRSRISTHPQPEHHRYAVPAHPGVSTSDQQGNSFQTDIRYRGFAASPVPGQPQGIAVYLNGVRINEAFGDTVNFDFIPTNAIDRADIQSNNPVFGLNALGGALNLQMKNGFTFQGFEAKSRAARSAG